MEFQPFQDAVLHNQLPIDPSLRHPSAFTMKKRSRGHTVIDVSPCWVDAPPGGSRQLPNDAPALAGYRDLPCRSLRAIRFDSHVRLRPQPDRTTANTRAARGMGRTTN